MFTWRICTSTSIASYDLIVQVISITCLGKFCDFSKFSCECAPMLNMSCFFEVPRAQLLMSSFLHCAARLSSHNTLCVILSFSTNGSNIIKVINGLNIFYNYYVCVSVFGFKNFLFLLFNSLRKRVTSKLLIDLLVSQYLLKAFLTPLPLLYVFFFLLFVHQLLFFFRIIKLNIDIKFIVNFHLVQKIYIFISCPTHIQSSTIVHPIIGCLCCCL